MFTENWAEIVLELVIQTFGVHYVTLNSNYLQKYKHIVEFLLFSKIMSFHCAFLDMYVLYRYGVYQDYYNSIIIPYIKFHEGLLTLEKVKNLNDSQFHVIVLDDLMGICH